MEGKVYIVLKFSLSYLKSFYPPQFTQIYLLKGTREVFLHCHYQVQGPALKLEVLGFLHHCSRIKAGIGAEPLVHTLNYLVELCVQGTARRLHSVFVVGQRRNQIGGEKLLLQMQNEGLLLTQATKLKYMLYICRVFQSRIFRILTYPIKMKSLFLVFGVVSNPFPWKHNI